MAKIQEAVLWLQKEAPYVKAGERFIPRSVLSTYFGANRRLEFILAELFDGDKRYSAPAPGAILNNANCHIGVFATLLLIGKGELIKKFLFDEKLSDDHCPLVSRDPPEGFPLDSDGKDIFNEFQQKHWQFFAHKFYLHKHKILIYDHVPLPFVESEKIGRGGSSNIYRVKIHKDHDYLLEQHVSP
jgi:hypothetical protein